MTAPTFPPSTAPTPASATAAQAAARINPEALRLQGANIYMVGIGGCGMSGLARLLRARGSHVTGSDHAASPFTDTLAADGFQIAFDQARQWLPGSESGAEGGCDLVVASAAIKPDHPQMLEAARRGVPVLTYAEALGRCMIGRTGIAVAGTHGKSTTTAMLGCAMAAAGLDPSVIIGATCPQLGGGFRLGADKIPTGPLAGRPGILAAEACEFNRSFHNFRPQVAAIMSVEADHLDIYGSLDAVIEAFRDFARLVPSEDDGGTLLIAHEGAHRREVAAGATCKIETIGFSPSADWSVRYDPPTRQTGLVRSGEGLVAAWVTNLPGEHNAMNAATAAALAMTVGADPDKVARSLGEFRGLKRRIEFLGERELPGANGSGGGGGGGGVRVYDDYGHHPTEIDATLRALRQFERPEERGGRLVCVFQPHQHSRTRFLLEEFASAFSQADVVIVPHIYFVRDSIAEKQKVSAADLVDRLRHRGVQAMHLYPFEAIVEQLEIVCRPNDLLVVMGAGPVNEVAYGYLNAGASKAELSTQHPSLST